MGRLGRGWVAEHEWISFLRLQAQVSEDSLRVGWTYSLGNKETCTQDHEDSGPSEQRLKLGSGIHNLVPESSGPAFEV